MDANLIRQIFERLLRAMLPGVAARNGPIRARVVRVRVSKGRMTQLEPRFSVDVRPLTLDLQDDPDWPVIPDVEVPIPWAGPGRGVFCLPAVGSIVRVGFYNGDINQPYVEASLGYGYEACGGDGRFLIKMNETEISIEPSGDVVIKGKSIRVLGDTSVDGELAVTQRVEAKGPVRSAVQIEAPAITASVLTVAGNPVPGSPATGTIVVAGTNAIQVQNGMIIGWS